MNRNLRSGTPLFANDQIILVNSEDLMQCSTYKIQNMATNFNTDT